MKKTLTEMLVDLRLDLKDSSTTWSDAELTRCVKRAVSDLSRFLPRERSKEFTLDLTVTDESITTPAVSDPDKYVDNKDISASVAGDTCTLAARSPDVPRPVKVTVTDANASITLFTIIVKGRDSDGNYIEESFYFDNGLVQTGTRYFAFISEVEIDAISGNGASDALDVGTGSEVGVWVDLANKPIKPRTETVTTSPAATTYARDTDYIMDDKNGRIAMKSGGSMVAATAHLVDYTKSKIHIDTNSIDDFIRLHRVEYPARNVPQTFPSVNVWDRIITFENSGVESQTEVSDDEHVLVYYYAEHSPPSSSGPGSYPAFMNTTVELAASAYALFIKAIQYELQAVTDFASARTAITALGAKHTSLGTALTAASTALAAATTALGSTKVDDFLSGGTAPSIKKYLDDGDNIAAAIDATTWLTGTSAPAAKKYLDDGGAYLTTVNDAERVSPNYADFARVCIELSAGLARQADVYNSYAQRAGEIALGFIRQAAEHNANGAGYAAVANAYATQVNQLIAEAEQDISIANGNLLLAERFRAEAMARRDEAWAIWRDPGQYAGNFSFTSLQQPSKY